MAMTDCIVGLAGPEDVDGILALQARNQIAVGGSLAASLPRARVLAMMATTPMVVARKDGAILGFLMTSERQLNADIPIVRAMMEVHPGAPDAYIYGPVCVDDAARGQRLAQAMFQTLRNAAPGREGILFIRQDNAPSLAAHRRMGMAEGGVFDHGGHAYAVFSYLG